MDAAEAGITAAAPLEIPEVPPIPQLPAQVGNGKLAAVAAAQPDAVARDDDGGADSGA